MKTILLLPALLLSHLLFAQNVGIGAPIPASKLHIRSGASGTNPFSSAVLLTVENNDHAFINLITPNASQTGILFGKANNAASGGIRYNNTSLTDGTPNGFQFRTNGDVTRMVIDQNGYVGIGVVNPGAMLHVAGNVFMGNVTMGQLRMGGVAAVNDFVIRADALGNVGYKKGYGAAGINYIIALQGVYPSTNPPFVDADTYVGEIKLFSGTQAPYGWAFCVGQLLPINPTYQDLFNVIGTTYGGDGIDTFALPDLQDAVPVHPGTNWMLGERNE